MKIFLKFYFFSFFSGGIVAIIFNCFWQLVEHHISIGLHIVLIKFTLMFFPLSIGYMAISGSNYWALDSVALTVMNALLYGFLGILAWLGYAKNGFFYYVLGGVIAALWFTVALLH